MDPATAKRLAQAIYRTLRDSNETKEIMVAGEITSVGRMDALVPTMMASDEGRRIVADRPRIDARRVDFAALRALPEGTLGRAYADHLARCGLDPDLPTVPVTMGSSDLTNYLLERMRQTHDVWHAVLGLGVQPHEEVLLHAVQWSQIRTPYSALIVFFGALKHMIGERRWAILRGALPDALEAGNRAEPLLAVYWEQRWREPLEEVRARFRVRPAQQWRGMA
jgi:ubiquinone biosynthesis protein COQ4